MRPVFSVSGLITFGRHLVFAWLSRRDATDLQSGTGPCLADRSHSRAAGGATWSDLPPLPSVLPMCTSTVGLRCHQSLRWKLCDLFDLLEVRRTTDFLRDRGPP